MFSTDYGFLEAGESIQITVLLNKQDVWFQDSSTVLGRVHKIIVENIVVDSIQNSANIVSLLVLLLFFFLEYFVFRLTLFFVSKLNCALNPFYSFNICAGDWVNEIVMGLDMENQLKLVLPIIIP